MSPTKRSPGESSNSQKTALTTQIGSASGCSKIYASCRRAYRAASVGGPDHQTSHRYSVVQPCHSAPMAIAATINNSGNILASHDGIAAIVTVPAAITISNTFGYDAVVYLKTSQTYLKF